MRRLVVGAWWWLAACPRVATRAACEFWVEVDGSAYTVALPDRFPFGAAEAAEVIAQISPGEERSLLGTGCADDACLAERLVAHARASGCRVAAAVDDAAVDARELAGCDWPAYACRYNLVWKYGHDAAALRRHYIAVGRRDAWFCGGAAEDAARYRALQALPFEVPPARPWRQDPRLGDACAAAYGPMADAPGRVRTYEDAAANRTTVASRPVPALFLGAPYGSLAARRGDSEGEVLYVEIPKAASTFIGKRLSEDGGRRIPNLDVLAKVLAPAAPAVFTVVREPLERFLSGYGQCGNQPPGQVNLEIRQNSAEMFGNTPAPRYAQMNCILKAP